MLGLAQGRQAEIRDPFKDTVLCEYKTYVCKCLFEGNMLRKYGNFFRGARNRK